jgi:hypothetical protein
MVDLSLSCNTLCRGSFFARGFTRLNRIDGLQRATPETLGESKEVSANVKHNSIIKVNQMGARAWCTRSGGSIEYASIRRTSKNGETRFF